MDTKFQTSFIPKKPIMTNGTVVRSSAKGTSFFLVIAIVVFVIVLAGAIGVFAYEQYLSSNIESMSDQLTTAEASLNTADINNWVRLDSRIESIKSLLASHLALTSFFDMLGADTLKDIRLKNFSFANTQGKIGITVDGQGDSFATVALQSDEFAKHKDSMSNQLISNLSLDQAGNVTFTYNALLNPVPILYANLISPNSALNATTSATTEAANTIVSPSNFPPSASVLSGTTTTPKAGSTNKVATTTSVTTASSTTH